METLAKTEATMSAVHAQLAEAERLAYAGDPAAPAALQALDHALKQADREITQFEKLMREDDAATKSADDSVIKFNLSTRRFN